MSWNLINSPVKRVKYPFEFKNAIRFGNKVHDTFSILKVYEGIDGFDQARDACQRGHGTVRPIVVGTAASSIFAGSQAFCSKKKKRSSEQVKQTKASEREGEAECKRVRVRKSPLDSPQIPPVRDFR